MKNNKLTVLGVIVGLLASLCCIGPLLALSLGLGFLGNISYLEPARPYLIGLLLALLMIAFYQAFIKKEGSCADNEVCQTKQIGSKTIFFILLVITIISIFSPFLAQYYDPCCMIDTK